MNIRKLIRAPSTVHGTGLFADEDIAANTLIVNYMTGDTRIITEAQHDPKSRADVRLIGDLFITGSEDDGDFINHADHPNCIYVFGLLFTKQDVKKGDELFVDYRHLNSIFSNDVVPGVSARVALEQQFEWLKTWIKYP